MRKAAAHRPYLYLITSIYDYRLFKKNNAMDYCTDSAVAVVGSVGLVWRAVEED